MYNLITMMSRRIYVEFAATLNVLRKPIQSDCSPIEYDEKIAYNAALDDVASDMCKIFARDNPRFEKNRFLTAAGVQP